MLLVGLTGGLGSGKSTVSRMLAERGAVVLDADAFARDAVRGGTPGFDRVVARFGPDVVRNGELDRGKLAGIVFNDEDALRDLESIVHPEVRRMVEEGVSANAGTEAVVVLVNPLLIEMGTHRDCDVVVVVSGVMKLSTLRSSAALLSLVPAGIEPFSMTCRPGGMNVLVCQRSMRPVKPVVRL